MNWNAFLKRVFACVAVSMLLSTGASADTQKIGVVGALSGQVTATSENGSTRILKAGDGVYLNDAIASSTESRAQIMFLDKSSLMINPDSKVTVDKFVFNPATNQGDLTIQNAKGALRFIGGALSKEKPVIIKTPVATIGIRGGIADTFVGVNGATDAVFVYGEELTMKNGSGQTASVTEIGKGLGIKDANSLPMELPRERIEQLNHTFTSHDANADRKENSNNTDASEDKTNNEQSSQKNEDNANKEGKSAESDNKQQDGKASDKQETGKKEEKKQDININTAKKDDDNKGSPKPPMGDNNPLNLVNKTNVDTKTSSQDQNRNENSNQFNNRPFVPDQKGSYAAYAAGTNQPISAGGAEFQRNGERFNGVLTGADGRKMVASLPWLNNAGYHAASTADRISIDGKPFVANGFVSYDQSMTYYQMQMADGGNGRLGLITGRLAPQASWAASAVASNNSPLAAHDLNFYSFLPGLMQNGSSNFGMFDYNVADPRLTQANANQLGNLGLVVDWKHERYLMGHMIWNTNTSTTGALNRELILSFGNTDTSSAGNRLLNGRTLEFAESFSATGRNADVVGGFLKVSQAYSATNGSEFGGMVVENVMPANENLGSGDAFNPANAGNRSTQGIVAKSPDTYGNQQAAASAGERDTRTMHGFAAGYMTQEVRNSNGVLISRSNTAYNNNDVNEVTIQTDATSGNVNAVLHLDKASNPNNAYVEAKFGNIADPNAQSAFLTNDLYASQQAKVSYKESSVSPEHTYTGNAVDNGAIVNASLLADVTNECIQCHYVDWGVWAGEINKTTDNAGQIKDIANMIPYVAGEVTENLAAKSFNPGVVTYNGVMYGQVLNGQNLSRQTGMFSAGIDLNNRNLKDFNANFSDMNFGFANENHAIAGSGLASFTADVHNLTTGSSPSNINGVINGALFGPNGQDIGGNFAVNQLNPNNEVIREATGIYLGTSTH